MPTIYGYYRKNGLLNVFYGKDFAYSKQFENQNQAEKYCKQHHIVFNISTVE